jgi:hypothetical protein
MGTNPLTLTIRQIWLKMLYVENVLSSTYFVCGECLWNKESGTQGVSEVDQKIKSESPKDENSKDKRVNFSYLWLPI